MPETSWDQTTSVRMPWSSRASATGCPSRPSGHPKGLAKPVYCEPMHAVTIVDGDLRWLEHPDPRPGPGEALVSVAAAGVNSADLLQRRGLYPAPPGWPVDIPGMEFAGEVVGLGQGADRFSVGDRVMGIAGGGGQAELVAVADSTLLAVPDRVPWDQAGGFPEAFCTAHDALFSQAGLGTGDRVLISGGAGGVGTAAVQLARAAGAYVVASVRSVARRPRMWRPWAPTRSSSPIEPLITGPTTSRSSWSAPPAWPRSSRILAIGGRVVVIGVGAGAKVELNLLALMGYPLDHPRFDARGPGRWRRRRPSPGRSMSRR